MPKTKEQPTVADSRDVRPVYPDAARVPTQLTHELLDWATAALTAVLSTPEVNELRLERPREALRAALKKLDLLWPYSKE